MVKTEPLISLGGRQALQVMERGTGKGKDGKRTGGRGTSGVVGGPAVGWSWGPSSGSLWGRPPTIHMEAPQKEGRSQLGQESGILGVSE